MRRGAVFLAGGQPRRAAGPFFSLFFKKLLESDSSAVMMMSCADSGLKVLCTGIRGAAASSHSIHPIRRGPTTPTHELSLTVCLTT
jgi:hypothetical protein